MIEKVRDNLYVLLSNVAGSPEFTGGASAVFITDGGVVLVDTKNAGEGPVILEKIKSVTDKPVTMIINTHTHGDHTGNDGFFGATVDLVAHENTKVNMEKMDVFKGENATILPKKIQGQDDADDPMTRYSYSSRLFLRLLGIVYLCAFWSLGVQVRGLFGHAGILPVTEFLATAARWISAQDPGASNLLALPTIFWFASSDAALVGTCVAGALSSLALIAGIAPAPLLVLPGSCICPS